MFEVDVKKRDGGTEEGRRGGGEEGRRRRGPARVWGSDIQIPHTKKFWLINICKKIKKIRFVQKVLFVHFIQQKPPNNMFRITIITMP